MSEWVYKPMKQTLTEKIMEYPKEDDITFFSLRAIWNFLLRGFLRVYFRLSISGVERLPKEGSYVLVANHTSHLDTVCLASLIPWQLLQTTFPVAAQDYFFSSFFKSLISAIFINALPFDRKKNPGKSLELCRQVLSSPGNVLIMFPEGTRSDTGEIQPFKQGIGALVAGINCLVVPVYVTGAHKAWPKHNFAPSPKKIRLTIGEPLNFQSIERSKEGFMHIAKETEKVIRQLQRECHEH